MWTRNVDLELAGYPFGGIHGSIYHPCTEVDAMLRVSGARED